MHLVRNSLRYASKKHWGQNTRQMRTIYEAPTAGAAETAFEGFAEAWRETYPAMINSWEKAWEEFTPFLAFPAELRRIVYTTNAIESLNARFRRAVRHRGHSPDRASSPQGALPCRHDPPAEPGEPDRQTQRMEEDSQHPDDALRRPHRDRHKPMTITTTYTNNLTLPS